VPRLAPSIVLIVAAACVTAACHPRHQAEQSQQTSPAGQVGERHEGHGLRRACANDIAKYCQNEDKKKRCLRENLDKLSADCKAALETMRGHRRGDGNGDGD